MTKNHQKAHFKMILNSYADGAIVAPHHAVELRALLACHTEAADKVGVGIDHLTQRSRRPERGAPHSADIRC